jgi:hypothetical protein
MDSADRVVMGQADLKVRSRIRIGDPDGFARQILEEMERELDRMLVATDAVTVLPRLELELEVDGTAAHLAREIGRKLASRVIAAAQVTPPVGEAARRRLAPVLAQGDARAHVALALAVRRQGADLAVPAEAQAVAGASLEGAADIVADLVADIVGTERPLVLLGRIARRGALGDLARTLAREEAKGVLARALAEIRTLAAMRGRQVAVGDTPVVAPRWVARARRVLSTGAASRNAEVEEPPSEEHVVLVAIALAMRLGPRAVVIAGLFADAEAGSGADAASVLPADGARSADGDAPPETGSDAQPPRDRDSQAADAVPATERTHGADPREERLPEAVVPSETQLAAEDAVVAPSFSPHAGIAFLLPLLRDHGLGAALSSFDRAPSLCVHRVLRRVLERLALPVADADPALYVLAGLLDAPTDEDRDDEAALWDGAAASALARAAGGEAASYDGAVDAWAACLMDEALGRLREVTGRDVDLALEVVALEGEIAADEERVEVRLDFPAIYGALLHAGMLTDLYDVAWLDGRRLILTFREEA